MKKTLVYLGVAAVCGAILATGLIYGLTRARGDRTDVIVGIDDIKAVAQLVTVEYHISTFLQRKKGRAWYEWVNSEFIVFLKGVVKGSVDLKLADMNVSGTDGKTVTIKFKKDAVLVSNPEIPPDGIRFTTVKDPNVFHPITDADRNKAQSDAIKALKEEAIKGGIIEKTALEAKVLLTGFLKQFGYTATIEFEGIKLP